MQGLEGPVVLDPELLTYTLDLGPCTMICEDRIESLGGTMRLGTGVRVGEGFGPAGSKDEMVNCTTSCEGCHLDMEAVGNRIMSGDG